MKCIIFAGGTGTRLWPISRKRLPKQFKKMFNGKSTLQMAVERIETAFGIANIYISTNEEYVPLVTEQLPHLPRDHVVGEPEKRNVGPAVGYNLIRLRKGGYTGPAAILWADHLVANPDTFVDVLKKGETLVRKNPHQLVFIGETPRYPENNVGWIHVGKEKNIYTFKEWCYKPSREKCITMYQSGEWYWNPGYFVVDVDFMLSLYKTYTPHLYQQLVHIEKALNTPEEKKIIDRVYPTLEFIHFDRIIEKIPPDLAVVLPADLGWSDPGSFYALKKAIDASDANVTKGVTIEVDTTDSLIINEEKKLVATIGLDGMIVVNTADALLVVHKSDAARVTELVEKLKEDEDLKDFV
jgi:mannose-1-phosphate guanylyltransferase